MRFLMQAHTTVLARCKWLTVAIVTIALGLGSRKYAGALPGFVASYAGDTLWAVLVYALAGAIAPQARLRTRAVCALAASFAIECSQLLRLAWLDSVRQTRFGALVLGQGFLWSDLVCYTAGAALGAIGESLVSRRDGRIIASSLRYRGS
jgi:hypothetical protein